MKSAIALIALAFAFIAPPIFASEYERQLAELTAQRDKAIAEASQPINARYRAALDPLLKKATQANDLDAAVKIKAALAAAAPASSSRFAGNWVRTDSRVQFVGDGTFHETYGGTSSDGRWQIISGSDAKVTVKGGSVVQFHMSSDAKTITRSADGYTWTREE